MLKWNMHDYINKLFLAVNAYSLLCSKTCAEAKGTQTVWGLCQESRN